MASLLLRSAARVLRRSLPQGPLRRSPAQLFVYSPRLFVSSYRVNKHSCTLQKGLPQRVDNRLESIAANVDANFRSHCSMGEQLELILQKEIEDELADKKRERVVLGVFAFLGLTLWARKSLFGGVKKEKYQAVKPLI